MIGLKPSNFLSLQGFGKRMRKWFIWERETFVCKNKDGEKSGGDGGE
jgi:hypothetical protein